MFDNEDTFRQLVAQSPELQARWHTITDDLINTAKSRWGVDIAKEDLATISAVKLFTLTGEKIGDPLEQMAQSMPAIKRAIGAYLRSANQSLGVVIDTPRLETQRGFADQVEEVTEGLEAALRLQAWWADNHRLLQKWSRSVAQLT